MKTQKTLWKFLLVANWAIIFWFWWQGSGNLFDPNYSFWLLALGRLAGLTAAYMILLQFFFMGRLPFLERVFGLDNISRLHHQNGKYGLLLLLLHPILLVFAYAPLSGKVIEVNDKLKDHPELVNKSPYSDGWLFKMECSDPKEFESLLSAQDYDGVKESH